MRRWRRASSRSTRSLEEKRGLTPALAAKDYLDATARAQLAGSLERLPAAFVDDKKVKGFEGFLFPATYEFLESTTSLELVDLAARRVHQGLERH